MKFAGEFGNEFTYLSDSQDLDALREFYPQLPDITGAFVIAGDGDYDEVWVCEESQPYLVKAHYYPLAFYGPSQNDL